MRFEHVLRRFAHKLMSLYSVNLYEVCNYYAKSIYNIYTFFRFIDSECNISICDILKTNKWPSDKIDKEITDKVV